MTLTINHGSIKSSTVTYSLPSHAAPSPISATNAMIPAVLLNLVGKTLPLLYFVLLVPFLSILLKPWCIRLVTNWWLSEDRPLRKSFKQLLKEAGPPDIRFRGLRHTAASLMMNNSIPLMVVSRRLGHVKPSFTLDVYGHLIPSKQREAKLELFGEK